MEVAANLSAPLLAYLRRVIGDGIVLTVADGWDELQVVVRSRPVDVLVIEPRGVGAELAPLYALMDRYPSLPVVAYVALGAAALQVTLELARHGVRDVVLRGFDDEPRRFRELLIRLPARRKGGDALAAIADAFERSSPLVRRAFALLFDQPHRFADVDALAHESGMTRRTLDRWLEKRGLATARMMIFSARLVQAYHYLREDGYLLEDVTRKLGYGSPRLFTRQVRATTGLTPSALREDLSPEQFSVALTALMRRRGAQVYDDAGPTPTDPGGG